jgi:peroxiredoxin Q/BCP
MIILKEGDRAPLFEGKDEQGRRISLHDYKDKKLVLYFFAEAGSPTCTIESCNLSDNFTSLTREGFHVLGVSPDSAENLRKFSSKYKFPFPLISDTEHLILNLYGAWDHKKLFGREYMGVLRTTFLIDEKGIIRKIFLKPRNKAHAEEIIDAWQKVK